MNFKILIAIALALFSTPAWAQEQGSNDGLVVAIEGGAAAVVGEDLPYGAGLGKVFILGYRFGRITMELQTGQTYTTKTTADGLHADKTLGKIKLTSVGLRYSLLLPGFTASVFGGGARVQIPALALVENDNGEMFPSAINIAGVGATGGAGIALPLQNGAFEIGVEARAVYAFWEIPKSPYFTNLEEQPDGSYTFDLSSEDLNPIVFTLTAGVRAYF